MSTLFTVKSFTTYDGVSLRYGLIHEDGVRHGPRPVIYVPGLGGSVKSAITFLSHLAPGNGPVFSLDARGFGLNDHLSPQPNPGNYLQDFHQFVLHLQQTEQLSPESDPVLLGLSLGAVMSTLYLTQFSHPFSGAVLVSPAYKPHPQVFTLPYKLKNYCKVLMKGTQAMTTMPYSIRQVTRNYELYNDPNFQDPVTLPSLYLFMVQLLCGRGFKKVGNISVPTAIVVPEKDLICDPEAMKAAYQRIAHPQKALLTYPELFHDVMMEPEDDILKVCEDVQNWLDSLRHGCVETQSPPVSGDDRLKLSG